MGLIDKMKAALFPSSKRAFGDADDAKPSYEELERRLELALAQIDEQRADRERRFARFAQRVRENEALMERYRLGLMYYAGRRTGGRTGSRPTGGRDRRARWVTRGRGLGGRSGGTNDPMGRRREDEKGT
jgi:hypothetical protein